MFCLGGVSECYNVRFVENVTRFYTFECFFTKFLPYFIDKYASFASCLLRLHEFLCILKIF